MSLNVGDEVPSFDSTDQNGNSFNLDKFKNKKIVLYFYPRDNTSGCTAQACDLRDNFQEFKNNNYAIVGVSTDSPKSHVKFIEKNNLPFDLIADEDKSVHKLFGTWVEKKMYGKTYMGTARKTFLIDENRVITDIVEKVKTKEHTNQILGE
ncbi:MAG: thioredoxin-dependent thiol peroxidase [Flammeovirgaceae bacterium TMED290]|nr:MAG: thioredoxin-dependent thiol peroxidase [Flammeovirgaceae bacterium TMED290]|tara:strand:- start:3422 stop:3874 length:453 start_codon:yes stop_codon:yes gene_type:complete